MNRDAIFPDESPATPPETPKEEAPPMFEGNEITRASLRMDAGFDPESLVAYRKRVEEKLKPIDVGDAVLGRAVQEVEIVPGKLKVTFRSLTAGHRAAILRGVQDKFGTALINSPEMSLYHQFLQLACGIAKIQEAELQDPLPQRGDVKLDEKILGTNLQSVRTFPDYTFWKIWFNFTWFWDRVMRTSDEESLRNG